MIRVAIVADSESRAQAFASALAEDERLVVVGARGESQFTDGMEAAADVVVAIACAQTSFEQLDCPLVVLTDRSAASRAHAHAWLPLQSSLAQISAAIIAAANDLTVFTADQVRQWRPPVAEEEQTEERIFVERLTPRELQVLRMLADGLGNKEIAGQLGLSDHTAKYHVAQILAKLGAASRTEAVTIGIRRGLVTL